MVRSSTRSEVTLGTRVFVRVTTLSSYRSTKSSTRGHGLVGVDAKRGPRDDRHPWTRSEKSTQKHTDNRRRFLSLTHRDS